MIRGLLSDVHGVLYTHPTVIPGSPEAVGRLREAGIPLLFLTNSTQYPKRHILETLREGGFALEPEMLLTAVEAAGEVMRERGFRRVGWLCNPALQEDLPGFEVVDPGASGAVDAVLVGDLRDGFVYGVLNRGFRWLHDGAALVALARNRFYQGPDGLMLDSGPFVRLLEEATGVESVVTGKPSRTFFEAGLHRLGIPAAEAAMIGDDFEFDVLPAMELGMTGVLVRTGKYREGAYRAAGREADRVEADLAAVAEWVLG
jgi:HAD superfamily hydrolase (TIGR01458 family)